MQSDAELLHQFSRTGDETAFGRLVERHAPMMRGVVLRTTGDATLADEVTQTVFAILARKARSLRHEALAGWLHRTSFLEARNASRKAARYRRALEKYQEQPMTPAAADTALPEEVLPHLDQALSKLKTAERQLVVLRYYEGQSVRDIACSTGTTEEACRKRLQRSLGRLGALLRRRGLATSTAGLAAILAGQNFCAPPASAAVLSAAALKTSTTLSSASLLTHTLSIVNAATAVKTAAAAVLLAVIPVTLLWKENGDLRREMESLRRTARVMDAAGGPVRKSNGAAEAPASPSAAAAPAGTGGAAASAAAVTAGFPGFSKEVMAKLLESQADMETTQLFNRICLSVDGLSEEQKTALRAEIERRVKDRNQVAAEALQNLDPAKLASPGAQLPEEETQKLQAAAQATELDEATLRRILTPEQYAQHEKAGESRRVAAAENSANDAIRELDRYAELSPEQKDQLFQKLATSQLNPGAEAADPVKAMQQREELMRSVLTPRQAEIYDQAREQEKQAVQKMLKLIPGLGEALAPSKP